MTYGTLHGPSPAGLNFTGYRNAEVDELLVEARSMTDQDRRKELYDRVQEILDAEQPYCFLYVPYALPIVQARFQGIKPALTASCTILIAGGFPKTCRGTMFGLRVSIPSHKTLRGGDHAPSAHRTSP